MPRALKAGYGRKEGERKKGKGASGNLNTAYAGMHIPIHLAEIDRLGINLLVFSFNHRSQKGGM